MNNNKKLLLSSTAIGAFGASNVGAVVNIETIDVDLDTNLESVYIDVDNGSFSQIDFAGQDLRILFRSGDTNNDAKAEFTGSNGLTILESGGYANYADRFSYGDPLVGTGDNFSPTESEYNQGDWAGFTGIAYLGFDKDGHKGWVELDYQAGAPGGNVLVRSFAYGTEGEITEAGVVPEPAHAAAVCALLAGSAAAFRRRRRAA